MPLYEIQRQALAAIAANRMPISHIAGGIVINDRGQRFSRDIDIFHDLGAHDDRVRLLKGIVDADVLSLEQAGFAIEWNAVRPEFYRAIIASNGEGTLLEWVIDSDFRFFAAVADDTFGYRLDLFDLATNKVLAAASRKEPRDIVDLLFLDETYLPLAAAIWAAPAKDPGHTAESLIEDIRRNCIYQQDDYDRLLTEHRIDAGDMSRWLKQALAAAETFVAAMPPDLECAAFLENGQPVLPDTSRIESYSIRRAERQAHWPSSSQIESAMIAGYTKD